MLFPQFKALLDADNIKDEARIGKILDCLKTVDYFRKIDSSLGSQHLVSLIPLLKPFVLREGFALINQNDRYVLLEGDLRSQENQFTGDRPFQAGRLIDLRESPHLSFVAFSDCYLVRISRGLGVTHLQQKKISEHERENLKLVQLPEHQQKLRILSESPFFSVLGNYDSYELAVSSRLKEYTQPANTHHLGDRVAEIGYVVSGKMQLSCANKKKRRLDNGITWFIKERDWIGLEEYLWEEPFQSAGEVYTVGAIVLWVPCSSFAAKFSTKTNHQAISRLISLTKTKKLLFDRSYNCRNMKRDQIQAERRSTREYSAQLANKIGALQDSKKNTHISRARLQASRKLEVPMPDFMLHKLNNLDQDPVLLPRIRDKVVFFPEEYEGIPISTVHKKQMNRLRQVVGGQRRELSHPALKLNPQTLYKTIYDKISYRFPQGTARSRQKGHSREEKTQLHHNCSIYNNFRVGKQKAESQSRNSRTLEILPHGV